LEVKEAGGWIGQCAGVAEGMAAAELGTDGPNGVDGSRFVDECWSGDAPNRRWMVRSSS